MGKTYLASQFIKIQRQNKYYGYVRWIDYEVSLQSSIIKSLNPFYKCQGSPESIYREIIIKESNLEGKCLMVIDNFNNEGDYLLVEKLLPNFDILIISDKRHPKSGIPCINLSSLDKESAMLLFEKYYTKDFDSNKLENLLQKINYHTSTIVTLAKILEKDYSTITNLLEIWQKKTVKSTYDFVLVLIEDIAQKKGVSFEKIANELGVFIGDNNVNSPLKKGGVKQEVTNYFRRLSDSLRKSLHQGTLDFIKIVDRIYCFDLPQATISSSKEDFRQFLNLNPLMFSYLLTNIYFFFFITWLRYPDTTTEITSMQALANCAFFVIVRSWKFKLMLWKAVLLGIIGTVTGYVTITSQDSTQVFLYAGISTPALCLTCVYAVNWAYYHVDKLSFQVSTYQITMRQVIYLGGIGLIVGLVFLSYNTQLQKIISFNTLLFIDFSLTILVVVIAVIMLYYSKKDWGRNLVYYGVFIIVTLISFAAYMNMVENNFDGFQGNIFSFLDAISSSKINSMNTKQVLLISFFTLPFYNAIIDWCSVAVSRYEFEKLKKTQNPGIRDTIVIMAIDFFYAFCFKLAILVLLFLSAQLFQGSGATFTVQDIEQYIGGFKSAHKNGFDFMFGTTTNTLVTLLIITTILPSMLHLVTVLIRLSLNIMSRIFNALAIVIAWEKE